MSLSKDTGKYQVNEIALISKRRSVGLNHRPVDWQSVCGLVCFTMLASEIGYRSWHLNLRVGSMFRNSSWVSLLFSDSTKNGVAWCYRQHFQQYTTLEPLNAQYHHSRLGETSSKRPATTLYCIKVWGSCSPCQNDDVYSGHCRICTTYLCCHTITFTFTIILIGLLTNNDRRNRKGYCDYIAWITTQWYR